MTRCSRRLHVREAERWDDPFTLTACASCRASPVSPRCSASNRCATPSPQTKSFAASLSSTSSCTPSSRSSFVVQADDHTTPRPDPPAPRGMSQKWIETFRNDFGTETGRNVTSWHTSAPFRTILLAAARWGLWYRFGSFRYRFGTFRYTVKIAY